MDETKSVKIPLSLYKVIQERIKGGDFLSVSDFITYAVRKMLSELSQGQQPVTEEEREEIKKRLKALGYIE